MAAKKRVVRKKAVPKKKAEPEHYIFVAMRDGEIIGDETHDTLDEAEKSAEWYVDDDECNEGENVEIYGLKCIRRGEVRLERKIDWRMMHG